MDFNFQAALSSQASGNLARSTAGALVGGLWQGMPMCFATSFLLKRLPKSTAALRFAVWAAVFAILAAMPFIDLFRFSFAKHAGTGANPEIVLNASWSYLLAGLWLTAAGYRLVQLAMQAAEVWSVWRSARPVSRATLAALDVPLTVKTSQGISRRAELCTSDRVDRPSVIGFFAPRILVPAYLFEALTTAELNHIVLHEMEHLRRGDDWVNLAQKVGLVMLPLNPALVWIDRKLSSERELACDDGVLVRNQMPRAYAASLASIAERRLSLRGKRGFGALALAATGLRRRQSELGERIDSILRRSPSVNPRLARGSAAAVVLGVLAMATALVHAPRLVSFEAHPSAMADAQVAAYALPVTLPPDKRSARTSPTVKFENAGFRRPVKTPTLAGPSLPRRTAPASRRPQLLESVSTAPKHSQLVVLTSWDESPGSRVVVRTPDGKMFLVSYTAVPIQAGWLLVQL